MENLKVFKLPKEFWVKGKSKFLHIRLNEEGLTHINQLVREYEHDYFLTSQASKQPLSLIKRIKSFLKQLFCRHAYQVEYQRASTIITCLKCNKAKFL